MHGAHHILLYRSSAAFLVADVSLVARLLRSIRLRGMIRTLKLIVEHYIFSHRTGYVVERKLSADLSRDETYSYRRATPDDAGILGGISASHTARELLEMINAGDLIFLALDHGRPVGFHVCSPRNRRWEPLAGFPLRSGQIWIVDIFTSPEYRRRHVSTSLRRFRERELLNLGYRETLSAIWENNVPSLAYANAAGIEEIQYFRFTRLLWFTRLAIVGDARNQFKEYLLDRGVPV